MKHLWLLLVIALLLVACTEKAANEPNQTPGTKNDTSVVTESNKAQVDNEPNRYDTSVFLTEEQKQLRELKSLVNFSEFQYLDCNRTIKEYELKFDDAVDEEASYEDDLKREQDSYDKIKLELDQAESSGDEREIKRVQSRFEVANEDLDAAEKDLKDWKKYRDRVYYTLEEVKVECQRMKALRNAE